MNDIDLPISKKIHNEVLSLPMGPHLSARDIELIIDIFEIYK